MWSISLRNKGLRDITSVCKCVFVSVCVCVRASERESTPLCQLSIYCFLASNALFNMCFMMNNGHRARFSVKVSTILNFLYRGRCRDSAGGRGFLLFPRRWDQGRYRWVWGHLKVLAPVMGHFAVSTWRWPFFLSPLTLKPKPPLAQVHTAFCLMKGDGGLPHRASAPSQVS